MPKYHQQARVDAAIERGINHGERGRTDGNGNERNHAIAKELRNLRMVDGVPDYVSRRCWENAVAKHPPPKRGPNIRAEKEYAKRIEEYKQRHAEQAQEKLSKKREEKAINAAIGKAAAAVPAKLKCVSFGEWTDVGYDLPKEAYEGVDQWHPESDLDEAEKREVLDDWEDAADEKKPAHEAMKQMTPSHVRVTPDREPIHYIEVKPHNLLAEARNYHDTVLRMQALRALIRKMGESGPGRRYAIMDIGSGAGGVKAAMRLRTKIEGADMVYHHCMFPILGAADLERDGKLTGLETEINWVTPSTPPTRSKVNVCRHTAAQCDCFRYYDMTMPIAIHSHYYFTDSDWRNIYRYANHVYTACHLPTETGKPIPECAPEFVWERVDNSRTASWWDKCSSWLRRNVLGTDDILIMEPLQAAGTTYCHRDPTLDVKNGGFHMMDKRLTSFADATANPAGFVTIKALQFAGCAVAMRGVAKAISQRDPFAAVVPVIKGLTLAAPLIAAQAHQTLRSWNEPPPLAEYTVRATVTKPLALKESGEVIAHIVKFSRSGLTRLEPNIVQNYQPCVKTMKDVASMVCLSKRDQATQAKVAVATCLRNGLGETQTKQTVEAAMSMVERIIPKNEEVTASGSDPPLWPITAPQSALAATVSAYAFWPQLVEFANRLPSMQERALWSSTMASYVNALKMVGIPEGALTALRTLMNQTTSVQFSRWEFMRPLKALPVPPS